MGTKQIEFDEKVVKLIYVTNKSNNICMYNDCQFISKPAGWQTYYGKEDKWLLENASNFVKFCYFEKHKQL